MVVVVTVVVAALLAAMGGRAPAQEADPAARRDEVQRQQAALAAEVDALRASDAEVRAALTVLSDRSTAQRGRLEDTQRQLDAAGVALTGARNEVDEARRELDRLQRELRDLAVAAYVRSPAETSLDVLLDASPTEDPVRQALARSSARRVGEVTNELRGRRQSLEAALVRAEQAERELAAVRRAEGERLAALDEAARQQLEVVGRVEERLDRALGEAAALRDLDAALGAEIERQQQELSRQLAAARAQAEAVAPTAPAVSAGSAAARAAGEVRVTTVRGIEVNVEIAAQVEAMLAAAAADGLLLEGSGYRSTADQIEIRRAVCGTSDYAIWEMPSWECSPPVARPGRSMHEQGLAIDFIADGDLVRSRATPQFRWLAANAERFGFYNLPSEPWHWSTTGS